MDHDENLPPSRQREILQQRKIAKPLMEKRRRERINNCLEQLKSLLTEVTKKLDDDEEENSYRSKLEKADILEMTVNYLKSVKRQKMTTEAISSSTSSADPASSSSSTSSSTSSSVHSRYVAGFRECAQQVAKYLEKADGLSATTRSTIIQHLTRRLHHPHQHQQQHHQHQHQQHQQQSISTSTIHQKHSNYLSGTTSSTASSSSSSSPRLMMISSPAPTAPPPPPPLPPPPAAVGFVVQTPPSFSSVSESVHSASVVPSHHPIHLLPVQLATGETVFVLANANDLIPLRQQIHIFTEQTMTTTTGGTKQTNEATIQQSMDTTENNGILIYEAISPVVVSPLQINQQNNHIDHPNTPPLSYPCSTSSSTSSSADVYGKLQMMNYHPPLPRSHPPHPLVKSDQSGTQWNSLFSNTAAASEFDPLESKCPPPPAGHCRALLSGDCFSSSSVVDGRLILLPLPQIDNNAMTVSDTCHQMNDDDPCQVWRPW